MSPVRMRVSFVLPLAAAVAVIALGLGFATLPRAEASSTPGTVVISPSSGPVGTPVQVFVTQPLTETTPVNYALGYTLTDPAAGGCNSQQPFPGVAPFGSREANGSASFNWPATLNKGPYWLCASPTSGGGKTLYTSQPYTVTAGDTPTATVGTAAAVAFANVPPDGVAAGSTFTITVNNWVNSGGTPPDAVKLTATDPAQHGGSSGNLYSAQFTTTQGPGAGDYVLTVTVPDNLATPLTYWAYVSDQGGGVYSGPFKVIAPVKITPTPLVSTASPSSTDGSSSFPIFLVPIIAGLVCVAVLILTGALLRRRARLAR